MDTNFYFLENYNHKLVEFAKAGEEYLYTDPRTSIFNFGVLLESLIHELFFIKDGHRPKAGTKLSHLICKLKKFCVIDNQYSDVLMCMSELKELRNKVCHGNIDTNFSEYDSKFMLLGTHRFAQYFFITYLKHDKDFKFEKFEMPNKPIGQKIGNWYDNIKDCVANIIPDIKIPPLPFMLLGGIGGVAAIAWSLLSKNNRTCATLAATSAAAVLGVGAACHVAQNKTWQEASAISLTSCAIYPMPVELLARISEKKA